MLGKQYMPKLKTTLNYKTSFFKIQTITIQFSPKKPTNKNHLHLKH
ncbi:hypothetical protein L289_2879 [Acinetobacter gerneri DSM 14967 = CIP 107464 = MTCC 9824]|nr:hypothetical protein L289_2879 [Acinetobacter gerneri DSM 14967 = CIP 107464 = MTCC 9824]